MRVVTPNDRSGKLPHDWRGVWSAFSAMKSVGKAIGEPVIAWQLEAPSGVSKMLDKRWKMRYTFKRKTYHAYIGITGREATKTINELKKGFDAILEGVKAEERVTKKTQNQSTPNPVYNAGEVLRAKEEWNTGITKVRDSASWEKFKEAHKRTMWIMSRKAGFLEMSMRDYLFKHPHGTTYPTPPKDQRQLDNRQREIEKMVRDREQRRNDRSR